MSIDLFSSFQGMVVAVGWSSEYRPGDRLQFLQDGVPLETITVPVLRPDVALHFQQAEAEHWGFRAYGVLLQEFSAASIALRFSSGTQCQDFPKLRAPDAAYDLFEEFVREVNQTGGTVLEIGARARSGNTYRDRFGAHVRYVGVDVSPGENVDVVADAHHLSRAITEKVDFVFSVSTFEHFLMPWKVALEINKVMRVRGKVFSHSHQTWPGHDEPWDYFRFSREAWQGLYNKHTGFRVCDARRGEKVAVINLHNPGGPFDEMERSPGYGMTVCVAEKVGEPRVTWDASVSEVSSIEYMY